MPRIPVHSVDNAPEGSADALKAFEAKVGKVIDLYGGMAASPAVINAYAGLQSAITEYATLDARARDAVALTVAAVNGCKYCQAAHTASGVRAGLTEEETVRIRAGQSVEERLDALLAVVRQATANTGSVDQETWDAALAAGWNQDELAELFAHVLANVYTTFFTHYARTEFDLPAAPPLPGE